MGALVCSRLEEQEKLVTAEGLYRRALSLDETNPEAKEALHKITETIQVSGPHYTNTHTPVHHVSSLDSLHFTLKCDGAEQFVPDMVLSFTAFIHTDSARIMQKYLVCIRTSIRINTCSGQRQPVLIL